MHLNCIGKLTNLSRPPSLPKLGSMWSWEWSEIDWPPPLNEHNLKKIIRLLELDSGVLNLAIMHMRVLINEHKFISKH